VTTPRAPLSLCPSLAAIALILCAGCGASVRMGAEHPEGCERIGPASGEASAKTLDAAADGAKGKLRDNAAARGANYVEVIYETHDTPGPFHDRTRAQTGGIAWRCPEQHPGD
jgi:hypothetical protein